MKDLIDSLILSIQKKLQQNIFIEDFPLDEKESKKEHSLAIRKKMDQFLKAHFQGSDESLLDMDNTPQGIFLMPVEMKLFGNISHTQTQAVFAIGESPLGIDLEERQRISLAPIKRVCTDIEIALIQQDPKLLWSIKEAAFKAIPFAVQPKVISEIQVVKIQQESAASDPIHNYYFLSTSTNDNDLKIHGFISHNDKYQLCVAIILKH